MKTKEQPQQSQLRKELYRAGATDDEVPELLAVASKLNRMSDFTPAVAETTVKPTRRSGLLISFASSLAGLAIGAMLILMSQAASPNSWLFPAQRITDGAIIQMRPQYRTTVMIRRAQQVNYLVTARADTHKILGVLQDYDNQAKAYHAAPNASYATLEFCKDTLEQAAEKATPEVHRAIEATLARINTD